MKKRIVIPTGRKKDILADITSPDELKSDKTIIFCHGYKGFKDWGAWNLVADEFAKKGFTVIKFNFSHNGGTLDNPIDFPDLEAFGSNTYNLEVADLNTVIDWTAENISKNINIIGHSRGGGIVTLVASKNPKLSSVISWAGVADFGERFPKGDKLREWKEKGVYYVINGRTKQAMPHYYTFYTDFVEHEEDLLISKAAAAIKIPHLIIHGSKDEAVSIDDANRLQKWNPQAHQLIIENANHTFGCKHPWNEQSLPSKLQEALNETTKFIVASNKM